MIFSFGTMIDRNKDPEYRLQITARNEGLDLGDLFESLMIGADLSQTDYLRIIEKFARQEKDLLCRRTLSKIDRLLINIPKAQRRPFMFSSLEKGHLSIYDFPEQLLDGRLAVGDAEYGSYLRGEYPILSIKDSELNIRPGNHFLSGI